MNESNGDDIGNRVDQLSVKLMGEFKQYVEDCRRTSPEESKSTGIIFEGWAIQKLAGLLAAVVELEGRVDKLERRK
jgi:hypothetical protein